ncbi:MAG: DUF4331 domain-containing protein [Bacteroidetes bacterium]|nr:MAG: DUF4331 domain-containing protein [Bacteroidota bacterium]
MKRFLLLAALAACVLLVTLVFTPKATDASSHREAPLISNDPLADNTDLYAFRSPDDTNTVTIIAGYIPMELPEGGPNFATFGKNIRYEIHIDNNAATTGDDIIYRFTFDQTNQDPTTFFNIRLGQQNLKTTYTSERSTDGGSSWATIVSSGTVPPPNIGPRSIENATVGLGTTYSSLVSAAIATASTGEKIYCGPADDPFFVDLGGVFDLGQTRVPGASGTDAARDGVAGFNCHVIAIQVTISTLQKDGKTAAQATNILDGDFVIGVWASASRQQVTTLSLTGDEPGYSGPWVQISRLGMPLTNEAVIPIGMKDYWNSIAPSAAAETTFEAYFTNPELGLYMDDALFGGAVPALSALRIQRNSLQAYDFGNTQGGLYPLYGNPATAGTALDTSIFGKYLLRAGAPRSVDILPIFYTGVPNLAPYQLATGKAGNPLANGKPFMNNFLPTFGDMLRLNMAVPVTPRNSADFSSLGIVQAAVLGLTDPRYNQDASLQWIPNMDGFPNGRRLEDDVTRIELQAVSGVALAAIGLWYDDYTVGGPNPVTTDLLDVLTYKAGPTHNDLAFKSAFPFVAEPHRGYDYTKQLTADTLDTPLAVGDGGDFLGLSVPKGFMVEQNYPNPFNPTTSIRYHVSTTDVVTLKVYNEAGQELATLVNEVKTPGMYEVNWNANNVSTGVYFYRMQVGDQTLPVKKAVLVK